MSRTPIDLTLLGEQLVLAAKLPSNRPGTGMAVSLKGALLNAASSLRDMAKPPQTDDEVLQSEHEERCFQAQPQAQAFVLEELVKHLDQLRVAVEAGNTPTVRRFLDIYGR
ncbi:hypothetical protein [Cupriavidus sp. TMH.W2]|uniref:hypothetical protein n=1 Tax=Cupriavidus sp. TMH.W2 TaxID=3434465 RepID=UPI003D778A46